MLRSTGEEARTPWLGVKVQGDSGRISLIQLSAEDVERPGECPYTCPIKVRSLQASWGFVPPLVPGRSRHP